MKEATFAYILNKLFKNERTQIITSPDEIKRIYEKLEKLARIEIKPKKDN